MQQVGIAHGDEHLDLLGFLLEGGEDKLSPELESRLRDVGWEGSVPAVGGDRMGRGGSYGLAPLTFGQTE